MQTSLFGQNLKFKVLVWPWKWGQGHKNLMTSFPCPNGVSVQVWSKSTYWFRRWVQKRLIFTVFLVWWPWKLGQGHPNLIKFFNYRNATIHSLTRIHHLVQEVGCRHALFGPNLTFKVLVWPLKWGHGHKNLTTSFPCLNGVSVQVWSKSTYWCRK